ncbi:MAG: Conserved hypothetical membrane protein, DUF6 family [Candidatus Uhrbacteria bacterium GW2011_GWF2_41_16]|uniref:Conserved hypothetical membrane protein, DUF6 family n=2 Tax=Candidatus Uhriibacteriota TaxID=1752732 RepID=A0A0G0VBT0_9BACT|nr:MAG: Conserved hypothetical membrane protein, DUF6 family [Candidatus Uhrbacteria bacterium GW2011_GWA2_41_10]KKR87433.1 MAG: Conserved hypothetical membrane protein, DUF6 family [Candidatus Uhrbacteria bacterium GW2011_GWC2_41_11]KKR98388.1 MAG: Conserved hypothetical membrane protein, DUF6 family [Candidatus Uhrbacteria bacterium GW2011_GWF2_41_16]HBP00502.1 hypothetical protein [Candidatus Uhrbacteria bacterium]
MYWILVALLSPILHGGANVLDNHFSNHIFKQVWSLIFYSSLCNTLFLPLVLLIDIPKFPPPVLLPFFFLIGFIEILYCYPYYKALQNDDTSVVSALFALGKIFVPIFAFFFIGETLGIIQYIGFGIIVLASVALTLNHHERFRFNRSFIYMLICSILLALEGVLYKYLFNQVDWSTGFVWPIIFSFLFALCLWFFPFFRKDMRNQFTRFRHSFHLFFFEEFLTFSGSAASTYAIALVPLTMQKSIDPIQPFFVLFYAMLLKKHFPNFFKEKTDHQSVFKKMILFGIMILGIILVVR